MMRHQLAELRARGEFLSVLLASEAPIYGRFGYGPATYTARLTVPRDKEHPLRRQFADFRAGEVSDDTDWLWVRLLDVPRALTARGHPR